MGDFEKAVRYLVKVVIIFVAIFVFINGIVLFLA